MIRVFILTISLFISLNSTVCAQQFEWFRLVQEMAKLQQVYSDPNGIRFDLQYKFSAFSQPNNVLDSMSGYMECFGTLFRMRLSNTETIKGDRYLIHLFNEDSLIYLSKSPSKAIINPLEMLDTTLASSQGVTTQISEDGSSRFLQFNFPPNYGYKSILVVTDLNTGYVSKTRYVVKTDQMTGISGNNGGLGEYSIVDCFFSNYQKGVTDQTKLDEKYYFQAVNGDFKPSSNFTGYRVFLGTVEL